MLNLSMALHYTTKFNASLHNIELVLHNSVVRYLGGIDPRSEWEARGLTAHDSDQSAKQELGRQSEKLSGFVNSKEGQEAIKNYLSEASNLLVGLLQFKRGWVTRAYLDNKKFTFVLGYMRTGGTYAMNQLAKIQGYDSKDYLLSMTHDSIPRGGEVHHMNIPAYYKHVLFDIAQYLVWVKREQSNLGHAVMKNINSTVAVHLLDGLFGEDCNIFMTLRNPLYAAESFKKLENVQGNETPSLWPEILEYKGYTNMAEWEKLDFYEKSIKWWTYLYTEASYGTKLMGERAFIAKYENLPEVLKKYAVAHGVTDYEPAPMIPEKEYNFDSKHVELAEEAMDKVYTLLGI